MGFCGFVLRGSLGGAVPIDATICFFFLLACETNYVGRLGFYSLSFLFARVFCYFSAHCECGIEDMVSWRNLLHDPPG